MGGIMGGAPKAPPIPAPPPQAAPATRADPSVANAGARQRSQAAKAAASGSDRTQSPSFLKDETTAKTTLGGG